MEKRQDRHDLDGNRTKPTRTQRHQNLYNEINSKIGFSDISSYESGTKIDLSNINFDSLQREEYQKVKEYKNIINKDEKEETIPIEKKPVKEKNFDINAVLEEAKKNRKADDELEKKRNLSGNESVLSSLNKKYLHTKDFNEEEDADLKEIIDTITSKTLVDDIKDEEEKELLSELLATTIDIKLEQELSNEEINKLYEVEDEESDYVSDDDTLDGNTDLSSLENSFFTHSVELKKEDLIDDDKDNYEEDEEEPEHDKKGLIKILLVIAVILALVLFITFFVLKQMGF